MDTSFLQKVLLTALAGFFAACLIWGFKHVMEEANRGAGNYQRNTQTIPSR